MTNQIVFMYFFPIFIKMIYLEFKLSFLEGEDLFYLKGRVAEGGREGKKEGAGGEKEKEEEMSSLFWFTYQIVTASGIGHAEARSQGLHLSLPCG